MAKIVDIADAVVTRLNAGPFSLPFTASRTIAYRSSGEAMSADCL